MSLNSTRNRDLTSRGVCPHGILDEVGHYLAQLVIVADKQDLKAKTRPMVFLGQPCPLCSIDADAAKVMLFQFDHRLSLYPAHPISLHKDR